MEEYAKSMVAKGANENEDPIYPGTPQDEESMRTILNEEPINLQGDITNSSYYIITTVDLAGLGVKVPEGQEYLVDYKTGEIWDKTNVKYEDGTYAYLSGTEDNNQGQKEAFTDSLISVVLKQNWREDSYSNSYVAKLKITDEMFDISEETAEGNTLNIDDFNQRRLDVKINGSSITITNVSFVNIGNKEYEATIEIPIEAAQALTNIDGTGNVDITIEKGSIIDDSGKDNENVVISSVINTGEKVLNINMAFSSNIVYETKTERYPDGYTDENGKTWGTGATIDLILTEPNGFREADYTLDYVWKNTPGSPLETDWNNQMVVHTTRGDTSVIAKIYVNEGSGEGTLYVRPTPSNNGDFENYLISANINLDNTAPHITSNMIDYIDNPYNIIGYYNSNNSLMGEPRIFSSSVDFLHMIDEETGIMKYEELASSDTFRYAQVWSKDNVNQPDEMGPMSTLGWSAAGDFHEEINSHCHYYDFGATTKNTLHPGISSGAYYLWNFGMFRAQHSEEVAITDAVGNELEQPYITEGLYIDFNEPNVNSSMYVFNDGRRKATIVLTDDFSGLSRDSNILKKIRYKWITDENNYDNTNMTELSESGCRIEYSVENQFGEYNRLEFNVISSDSSYKSLLLEIDGYTDIAGNPITESKIVKTQLCDHVDVEVKEKNQDNEYDKTGYPITCEINFIAKDENDNEDLDGVFLLKKIEYEHVGLNDKITVANYNMIASGKKRCEGHEIIPFQTLVNGPINIIVTLECGDGREAELTIPYTIKYVQEMIFEIDLSKVNSTEFALPYWGGTVMPDVDLSDWIKFTSGLVYVDWGDGNCDYINKETFAYCKPWNDDEAAIISLLNSDNIHNYGNKNRYLIKISGNHKTNFYLNFAESVHEARTEEFFNSVAGQEFRNYYYNSRNSIVGVKQYGFLGDITATDTRVSYSEMFRGCENLTEIPTEDGTGSEINNYTGELLYDIELSRNAFKYLTSANCLFQNTSITAIDEKMFSKSLYLNGVSCCFYDTEITEIPENLFKFESNTLDLNNDNYLLDYSSVFYSCEELTSIPEKLFQYRKGNEFDYTFYDCVNIRTIPKDLFLGQNKATSFQDSFFNNKSVTSISKDLFKDCASAIYFDSTFMNCERLTSVPNGLFDGPGGSVKTFEDVFKSCISIESIGENLFKENVNVLYFRNAFDGCEKLKEIPQNLFKYNPKAYDFSSVFSGCKSITSIPNDLFRTTFSNPTRYDNAHSSNYLLSSTDFGYAFYNASITNVSSNIWWDKGNPENLNQTFYPDQVGDICSIFERCDKLESVDDALFENFSNVSIAIDVFKNCSSLMSVNSNIFKGCNSIYDIGGMFYNCGELTSLGKNVFSDFESKIIESSYSQSRHFENGQPIPYENMSYHGAFSGCHKLPLNECPELWKLDFYNNSENYEVDFNYDKIVWKGNGINLYKTYYNTSSDVQNAIEQYYNTHSLSLSPKFLYLIDFDL